MRSRILVAGSAQAFFPMGWGNHILNCRFFHFELRADLETRGMSMGCFLGGGEAIVPIQSSIAAQRQNQLESRERGIQEIPY